MTEPTLMTAERWDYLVRRMEIGMISDELFEWEELANLMRELVADDRRLRVELAAKEAECERYRKALERVRDQIGEAVHVSFRKGTDAPGAYKVWLAIRDMDNHGYSDAMTFALYGLGVLAALNPEAAE